MRGDAALLSDLVTVLSGLCLAPISDRSGGHDVANSINHGLQTVGNLRLGCVGLLVVGGV